MIVYYVYTRVDLGADEDGVIH